MKNSKAPRKAESPAKQSSQQTITELDWFSDAILALKYHRLLLLVGHQGRGKTSFARWAANSLGCPDPLILQGNPAIEQHHFWGYERLVNGNMVWEDGFLANALKTKRWLIIEDFNAVPVDVRAVLNDLRDGRESCTNPLNKERILVPPTRSDDYGFRIIATANPESMKCNSNRSLGQALLDGFICLPEIPEIDLATIRSMLASRFPNASPGTISVAIEEWEKYRQIRGKDESSQDSHSENGSFLTFRSLEQLVGLLESGMRLSTAVEYSVIAKFRPFPDLYSAAKIKFSLE
ncbi:MAG TPA: AAA family ATPase [Pirellulaceae bacterium]|nr:AAA family ATPase [Pirellulaceae bacterium]HMO94205.1 AAA family ATPase [Pirellulaceae bacterium]HMP71416.1 AAA family ATPase [Pirellulaceae bacterium]